MDDEFRALQHAAKTVPLDDLGTQAKLTSALARTGQSRYYFVWTSTYWSKKERKPHTKAVRIKYRGAGTRQTRSKYNTETGEMTIEILNNRPMETWGIAIVHLATLEQVLEETRQTLIRIGMRVETTTISKKFVSRMHGFLVDTLTGLEQEIYGIPHPENEVLIETINTVNIEEWAPEQDPATMTDEEIKATPLAAKILSENQALVEKDPNTLLELIKHTLKDLYKRRQQQLRQETLDRQHEEAAEASRRARIQRHQQWREERLRRYWQPTEIEAPNNVDEPTN